MRLCERVFEYFFHSDILQCCFMCPTELAKKSWVVTIMKLTMTPSTYSLHSGLGLRGHSVNERSALTLNVKSARTRLHATYWTLKNQELNLRGSLQTSGTHSPLRLLACIKWTSSRSLSYLPSTFPYLASCFCIKSRRGTLASSINWIF